MGCPLRTFLGCGDLTSTLLVLRGRPLSHLPKVHALVFSVRAGHSLQVSDKAFEGFITEIEFASSACGGETPKTKQGKQTNDCDIARCPLLCPHLPRDHCRCATGEKTGKSPECACGRGGTFLGPGIYTGAVHAANRVCALPAATRGFYNLKMRPNVLCKCDLLMDTGQRTVSTI